MNPPPTVQDLGLWLKHRREVIGLAKKITDGEIGVIEGCREILIYQDRLHAQDTEEFRIFLGIDSESDGLPIGRVRMHWSASALKQKDTEIKAFEDFYRPRAVDAAMRIIEKYE